MEGKGIDRRRFVTLGLAGSAWLLMGHSPYGQYHRFRASRLIIVTDQGTLRLGEVIARVLARYRPETRAMIGTTPSSLDTVKLLKSRQLHVALLAADEAWEALQGIGKFTRWEVPLRTLAVLNSRLLHLVTLASKGISGIAELTGKSVATGTPGSRTEIKTHRVLEAYGIDPGKDIHQEVLALPEAVKALKAGKIDALAQDGTIPNRAIRDLAASPGMTIKLLSHGEAVLKMRARYGRAYHRGTIPGGTYSGVDTDVAVAATAHLLVSREDFPRDRAYQLAKALAEHQDEWASPLQRVHRVALTRTPLGSSLPFHPGALDYYQEKNR